MVEIDCVPDETLLVPPAPPTAETLSVAPDVKPVRNLIAAPPPPPPPPSALPPLPPPPTTVTLTAVTPEGIVNVPVPVKTCPLLPTYAELNELWLALVTRPLASTTIEGIADELPYVPAVTPEFSSFAPVTLAFAILAVVTALSAMSAVSTAPAAIFAVVMAESAILAVVTLESVIFAVVTDPSAKSAVVMTRPVIEPFPLIETGMCAP